MIDNISEINIPSTVYIYVQFVIFKANNLPTGYIEYMRKKGFLK